MKFLKSIIPLFILALLSSSTFAGAIDAGVQSKRLQQQQQQQRQMMHQQHHNQHQQQMIQYKNHPQQ